MARAKFNRSAPDRIGTIELIPGRVGVSPAGIGVPADPNFPTPPFFASTHRSKGILDRVYKHFLDEFAEAARLEKLISANLERLGYGG